MHSSVLYIFRKNVSVAAFHAVNVIAFALVAWLTVPRWGLVGYGWGEMGGLLSYIVLFFAIERVTPRPQYWMPALWSAGFAIGLFWRELGLWALAAPVLALLWPPSIAELRRLSTMIIGHVWPRPASTGAV
jgi:PST family polysaccharide transporter